MNEPLALPTIALRAPRKFACHTLPDTPLEPPLGDAGRHLARAVASASGLGVSGVLSLLSQEIKRFKVELSQRGLVLGGAVTGAFAGLSSGGRASK